MERWVGMKGVLRERRSGGRPKRNGRQEEIRRLFLRRSFDLMVAPPIEEELSCLAKLTLSCLNALSLSSHYGDYPLPPLIDGHLHFRT